MTDLLDARLAGRKAGELLGPAGWNPYQPRSDAARVWETERLEASGQVLERARQEQPSR